MSRLRALAFAGSLLLCRQAAAVDNQVWPEVMLTQKWTDRLDLIAASALRLGEGVSSQDRFSCKLGGNVRVTPEFTLAPNYQYITHQTQDGAREYENRLSLVSAIRVPFASLETMVSLGLEYRFRHIEADTWRLRPRLRFKHPLGPERWGLAGYIADELFYDGRADEWTTNRLFIGFEKKMRRNWVLDLYACRERDLRNGRPDLNILGISMRFSIDSSASDPLNDLDPD